MINQFAAKQYNFPLLMLNQFINSVTINFGMTTTAMPILIIPSPLSLVKFFLPCSSFLLRLLLFTLHSSTRWRHILSDLAKQRGRRIFLSFHVSKYTGKKEVVKGFFGEFWDHLTAILTRITTIVRTIISIPIPFFLSS